MKKFIYIILGAALTLTSCANNKEVAEGESEAKVAKPSVNDSTLTWYDMEQGIMLAQKEKKKIFVDVYTDWCGWCKKMDASTFKDAEVIKASIRITLQLNSMLSKEKTLISMEQFTSL